MSSTSGALRNAIYRACEEGQELHLFQQPLHCVFSVESNVLGAFPEVVLHLGLLTDSWNGFMVYLENIYYFSYCFLLRQGICSTELN